MGIEYNQTTWVNGDTPLNAANMNNIEQGIADLAAIIDSTGTIPTKTSQLENDSGYITQDDIQMTYTGGWSGGAITTMQTFDVGFMPTSLKITESINGKITSTVTLESDYITTNTQIIFTNNGFTAQSVAGGQFNKANCSYKYLAIYEGFNPLPTVSASDEGKLLAVNAQGKWDAEQVLPQISSSDNGKILGIQNGQIVLADIGVVAGGNVSYDTTTNMLTYTVSGEVQSQDIESIVTTDITATNVGADDVSIQTAEIGEVLSIASSDNHTKGIAIDNDLKIVANTATATIHQPYVVIGSGHLQGSGESFSFAYDSISVRDAFGVQSGMKRSLDFDVGEVGTSIQFSSNVGDDNNLYQTTKIVSNPTTGIVGIDCKYLTLTEQYQYLPGSSLQLFNGGLGVILQNVADPTTTSQAQMLGRLAANKNYVDTRSLYRDNVTVPTTDFTNVGTYNDYPYEAIIDFPEADNTMTGSVTFGLTDAISGNFAPIANVGNGVVTIYAQSQPTSNITVPLIEVAVVPPTYSVSYILNDSTSTNTANSVRGGLSYSTTISPISSAYVITDIMVTMGGDAITDLYVTENSGDYDIDIPHVCDNIAIFVTTTSTT